MNDPHVKVTLEPLKRFARVIHADTKAGGNGPIWQAILQWGVRYRRFILRRFNKFSRGGGDWAKLKKSTIAARKRKKARRGYSGPRSFSILQDTGMLKAALKPNFTAAAGALQERIRGGIRVGYGGPGRHPKGKATVADIASFHHVGNRYMKPRKIIVDPDARTVRGMETDMERALERLGKQCERAGGS